MTQTKRDGCHRTLPNFRVDLPILMIPPIPIRQFRRHIKNSRICRQLRRCHSRALHLHRRYLTIRPLQRRSQKTHTRISRRTYRTTRCNISWWYTHRSILVSIDRDRNGINKDCFFSFTISAVCTRCGGILLVLLVWRRRRMFLNRWWHLLGLGWINW